MKISEKIAKFTLDTKPEAIPDSVVSHAKLLLLDTIGVAMISHDLLHAKIIEDVVKEMGGKPDATLWGSCYRGQLSNALLYNSALIHGVDFDDTYVAGIVHPSASVVATAITVGEYVNASPQDILTAIIIGWEVIVALAVSANGRFHDVGYHASGLLSSFASACVAARLMGDKEETLCDALGICGSQAAALQEFLHDGSWTKKMHPGWGCHAAYYALMLARRGYKGPQKVFEGDFGLFKTHIGTIDGLNERIGELSKVWRTTEITFKLYPVCHFTHSFIDCALLLRREHGITPANIERIICRIDSRGYSIVCDPLERKKQPDSDYLMRFSLPYVVSVALAKGRFSSWDIDIVLANDPEIKELMQRMECVMDEGVQNEGHFPGYIDIITKDGDKHHVEIPYEKGAKGNPITKADVVFKFNSNLSNLYPANRIEELKKLLLDFENIGNVSKLINELKF